jgi:acetyl esterase
MPLDPIVKMMIDATADLNLPPWETLTPDEVRAQMRARPQIGKPEDVARVEDRSIPGPNGPIPVRIYQPEGEAPFPLLVYFHGGGWVIGDIESHDMLCRSLANASGCVVASVDYRLSPEHKYPVPLDDCYAATKYFAEHAAEFNGDPSRLAVGGDSAGGNLATVVSLIARDRGGPTIGFQLLVYPVIDFNFNTPSYRDNAEGYFLTANLMKWFWNHYLRTDADGAQPDASPMRADSLRGLPPALVITAEFDPLRDEGEAYAAKLLDAGVSVSVHRYDGMLHNFILMAAILPQARAAIDEAALAIRNAFAAVPAAK